MNKVTIYCLLTIGSLMMRHTLNAQTEYTLKEVIEMARAQSPSSKQAETRKENRYWQYRYYKTNYNPQLRLSGNVPNYNQDVYQNRQDDGSIVYQQREQTTASAGLALQQPIFFTGGNISVNTSLDRYDDYLFNTSQWSGTVVNISIDQPIFSFNSLRWDRKTEPLRYEESKREYVEEMESIARDAVDRYFAVLDGQIGLQIAEFNLANNDTIYKIEQGRYNIGTTPKDKLLQAELQLLRSQQDVTSAKINLENARLNLRSFLGLNDSNTAFTLALPEDIPVLQIDMEQALQLARQNRADFVAFERRKIEAEREVAEARGQRFQMDLTASFGMNDQGNQLDEVYNDPFTQQRANISLNMPVMDWGRNKARMRTALANKRLNDYVIAQDEVNFEQEIITQVRQFDVLLSQLEITRKSDLVAQERYVVSQNRYLVGKIDITNLNIALTEKDSAKRSYLGALQDFWSAYYDMRRLTLYDFSKNELLYMPNAD